VITVSVVSLKGGVGKTSVVLGLAGAAQAEGLRCLVVDLDPQANTSLILGSDQADFTTNDVLADGGSGVLADAIQESGWGPGVDVVPSELTLERRNTDVGEGLEYRLRRAMEGVTGYDLVLLDSPPALNSLAINGLTASDRALVVTEPTVFSVVGAEKALDAVDVVRRNYNSRLRPAGIVVNKARRSAEHEFRVDELRQSYPGLVWLPAIPDRAVTFQAQGAFVPVQRWRSAAAEDLRVIFADFLDRLLSMAPRRR
jgi:chromosome partitioning protein